MGVRWRTEDGWEGEEKVMVLDGSKEASLPSCGDQTLSGAPTQSNTLRSNAGDLGSDWRLILQVFPPLSRLFRVNESNAPPPHFIHNFLFSSCSPHISAILNLWSHDLKSKVLMPLEIWIWFQSL